MNSLENKPKQPNPVLLNYIYTISVYFVAIPIIWILKDTEFFSFTVILHKSYVNQKNKKWKACQCFKKLIMALY